MKRSLSFLVLVALLGIAAGAGYWLGMSKSVQAPAAGSEPLQPKPVGGKGKILYYRNPMGLPDTSPVPKKDPMGMDYVAVYEGEEPEGPALKITLDKVQKLGVKTEAAALRRLSRTLRALGTIQIDERAQRTVAPRFEGWIQRLHVNATGQFVRQGQALMDVYSPDLMTAQQEYLVAIRGAAALKDASPEIDANMHNLVEGSIQRLRNWEIAEEELARLRAEGKPRDTITLRSPASGVVLEKPAVQGMRFMPGEMLYRIADLSSVWLLADVFEQDLGLVRAGQAAKVRVSAYPDKVFEGKVAFVYPTVTAETRTAKVRIEMPNVGNLLKPDMYASVELSAERDRGRRLSVPDSAVLDSGTRQTVLVRRGEGLFEPREVRLGMRGDGYVEVRDGIKEGEEVVVSANFLIDSESNLKAAVGGFGRSELGSQSKGAAAPGAKTYVAEGTVESVDAKASTVGIAHGPIASLNWPGMTMEFRVKDPGLLQSMKAGARIRFEFVERAPGEWVVVGASPLAGGDAAKGASSPDAHAGH